jgi:hypothetical protein
MFLGKVSVLIDINFVNGNFIGHFGVKFFEDWTKGFTGTTPRSPEVDKSRFVTSTSDFIEAIFV